MKKQRYKGLERDEKNGRKKNGEREGERDEKWWVIFTYLTKTCMHTIFTYQKIKYVTINLIIFL